MSLKREFEKVVVIHKDKPKLLAQVEKSKPKPKPAVNIKYQVKQ